MKKRKYKVAAAATGYTACGGFRKKEHRKENERPSDREVS
jgi:hypothetical protein